MQTGKSMWPLLYYETEPSSLDILTFVTTACWVDSGFLVWEVLMNGFSSEGQKKTALITMHAKNIHYSSQCFSKVLHKYILHS